MKQPTIAIIGVGAVGSTTAYALMMRNIASHLLLVDIDEKRCCGEVQDLSDALSLSSTSFVAQATIKQAGQADIIIIAAGIPQKPGQTRLELLNTNHNIIRSIMRDMQPIKQSSIIIMVTNPVDILTRLAQDISGLPRNQVFGSGTFLDTQRLRGFISQKLHINQKSIHVYVLGEHGDSQFVPWSNASIGGVPIHTFPGITREVLDQFAQQTKQKVYEVIENKGYTSFSIAACVSAYVENIISNGNRVMPLSCFVPTFNVCINMPAVLGNTGIKHILQPPFNVQEQQQLTASVEVLQNYYAMMQA